MRIWKVVSKRENNLYSYAARNKALVQYKIGKWVQAPKWLKEKGYYLTAFITYEQAFNFIPSRATRLAIYRAKAKGIIKELPHIYSVNYLSSMGGFGEFVHPEDRVWPLGTIMCKKIKLIKEIKWQKDV